ncbi:WD40 repeat domain-containing protein [Endozoicomonas sp. ISHI1]|uniref:WD40 repeat domain-containing protein n=1 Tax=Endozoicomonas sp. ISHI1 TaxID=2825882 RepID=UPI002149130E|nr:hypothetical protein [Endozoicomonas sp. ISHI1]
MNFGKGLAIASLIMSLTGSLTQAQMSGSNQRAQIPPQLFYKIAIDPNQPQAIPTSTPTATLPARCGPHRALSIAWNKNSTLMAVGVGSGLFLCGRTGALQIFDMSSGIPRLLRTIHATEWVESVAFSPDGTRLVAGGDDDTVNVYEGVSPFNHLQTLTEGASDIETVAINYNGTLLAVGGEDTEVRLYLKNRRSLFTHVQTLSDAGSYIVGVDFHPINGQLAVGEESHRVRIYSGISPYNRLKELFVSRSQVLAVAYNPNGTVLATADNQKTIRLYNGTDPDESNPLQTFTVAERISSIAFNREGTRLLVGFTNGRVDIFEGISSLVALGSLPYVMPPWSAFALAFSPDGKWLSIGREDILMFRVDGVRAPTPTTPASSTEAITTAIAATAVNTTAVNTTAVNTTAVNTTAVNMTVVNTTDASTEASTKMDNSSTLKALSLITLLTAVLHSIVMQ